uniref:PNK FHA domain-containing protein n=1 Tax=Anopheles maculatus TaxID=74869 RepID=A0A182T3N0_9DIPT
MPAKLKECILKPVTAKHPPIRINTEQTIVGRSPDTLIQDANCSRKQGKLYAMILCIRPWVVAELSLVPVCLKANLKDGYVLVKTLGLNPSVLNGKELQKNVGYEAVHGDTIELLPGMYKYVFEFIYEPSTSPETVSLPKKECKPVDQSSSTGSTGKRSREEHSPSGRKSKRSKADMAEPSPAVKHDSKSPKPTVEAAWQSFDDAQLHIYTSAGVVASEKVAAYDMDGTLIKTKSGNVFPKSIDDWQIAFPEVPGKLKSLHRNGFKLVIFTNQAGIGKGKVRIEDFRQKIEALVRKLSVPMQVFIATGAGKYRKPRPGMWQTLCDSHNDGVAIDRVRSFYVGDAAGRPELKKPIKRKKDH